MRTCRICGGDIAETYSVKEMMLGLREPFDYNLCGDCGCLQISEIPADMSIYYPGDYYSFLGNKKKKTI